MSNLASIQRIVSVEPIEGADKIEVVTVLGWRVVTKKGEYKVGDLCCYIQIDTVVPDKPEFEFLRERKFRVKTIKLRGQVSQGLIIPVPVNGHQVFYEGDDVTELVGVVKYEKPDNNPNPFKGTGNIKMNIWERIKYRYFPSLVKDAKRDFPKHLVSITDEERIQNIPKVLSSHKGKIFVVSYKLDGSSITIIHEKKLFKSLYRVCSRRFELLNNRNAWHQTFNDTNFKVHIDKLVKYFKTNDIIVQGEMIGKPNGNHHALTKNEIRLFNIFVNGTKIHQKELWDVCEELNIPHCPIYTIVTLNHSMDEILKLSMIKDVLNPKVEAEGLVWRCIEDGTSFKVINNNYLLKHE